MSEQTGPCIECGKTTDTLRKNYPYMGGMAFYCLPCQEKNGRVLTSNKPGTAP